MISDVLVTLCNSSKRNPIKLVKASSDGEVRPVELPSARSVLGATSCIKFRDGFLLCLQSSPSLIVELDGALNEVAVHEIRFLSGIHGLVLVPDGVLAVSTGQDAVVLLDHDFKIVRTVSSFEGAGADVEHFNDICLAGDEIYVSCLGPRRATGLRNGSVRKLATGEVVFDGLNEPHSVSFHDGRIHVLDSATGSLFRFEPGLGLQRVVSIMGYARGLALDDETIVIGRSTHRNVGRTSTFQHGIWLAEEKPHAGPAYPPGVFFHSPRGGETRFVPVANYGSEIYQILPVPAGRTPTSKPGA